ncbi:hypothetical protein ACP70R_031098 [Stipagrostis hirtigluma subsp. patula]
MKILESPLMGEFIAFLKTKWSGRSRIDQSRRRLRQLVAMVRGVTDAAEGCPAVVRDGSLAAWFRVLRADALRGQEVLDADGCDAAAVAGSARRFLAGLRTIILCSPEVDRLTEAVEELERLAGPGGDLHLFIKVLQLEDARVADMEVDGGSVSSARFRRLGSSSVDSVAAGAELPMPGAKRKRACGSGIDHGGSTSSHGHGQLDAAAERRKRRVLSWVRPHHWLPSLGGLFAGPRAPPPPPPAAGSHSNRARTVALAMSRVRRRIGKPSRRRRQPSLGQRLSRLSL